MRYRSPFLSAPTLAALFLASAFAQTPPPPAQAKILPPRIAPSDYQAQVKIGDITLAADFTGHGVPTPDGTFTSEGNILVELAFYGPTGKRLNVSFQNFSLRVNGKKSALPAQPYESSFGQLKDPEWEPPTPVDTSSKSGINAGGGGGGRGQATDAPPPPPKMPLKLVLIMENKVKLASLPEGEHNLPVAGLVFFNYGGNTKNIRTLDLIYNGPAGKAVLPLR